MFKTVVFDALEETGDACFLGGETRWRPTRARPLRCAPPDPTRPWCVRVLDSTSILAERQLQCPGTAPLADICVRQNIADCGHWFSALPIRVRTGLWGDGYIDVTFPDMPCMKRICRDKKASVHWSAARKKERLSSR